MLRFTPEAAAALLVAVAWPVPADAQIELLHVDAFVQREPGDGVPASRRTEAFVAYDASQLYVVFVCEELDPAAVRAHLAPREAVTADDQVAVLLDTFRDGRRAYLFAANPFGVQADALVTEGQPDDYSFDTVWSSSGELTPRGYRVTMTIPFKSLRLPAGDVQRWGIALRRTIPRNSEESYWPAITRRIEGLVPQFGTLDGLRGISPGRHVQVIPYGAAAIGSTREPGAPLADVRDARAGVDAKVVLRDAVTVDVAVNPDFSQVESDQPQVTTNQRFEVFFPEKRPFFIENAGYFLYSAVPAGGRVPETLFFSRRIVDPDIGVRVTGKIGPWAVGALAVRDQVPRARMTEPVGAAASRVQRELGARATIGVMASTRNGPTRANRVTAVDARLKWGDNWVATGLLAASRTADNGNTAGAAINLNVNRTSRRILYNVFYSDRSPSFRADLGFVPRTDIRQIEQYIEYRWRPAAGPVVAVGPNSYFRFNWDRRGRLQEWVIRYPFQLDLKGRTSVFARRVESAELFRERRFRQHLQTLNVQTEWLRWLVVNEGFETGRSVNYFPPAGIAPEPADFRTISLTLSIRPTPQFRTDLTYLTNRLQVADGRQQHRTTIFDSHVSRLTLNYQFTRRLSVRGIVDYRAVLANPALVALSRDKRLVPDVLVTYLTQPGTAMYIGYTAAFANAHRRDGDFDGHTAPTVLQSRQLFVKTSYLLRF